MSILTCILKGSVPSLSSSVTSFHRQTHYLLFSRIKIPGNLQNSYKIHDLRDLMCKIRKKKACTNIFNVHMYALVIRYQTSCAVNQSSYSKLFLLQNFMNINGTTLFLIFLSPRVSEGPQKPQTLTASKTKYEKFGPKI